MLVAVTGRTTKEHRADLRRRLPAHEFLFEKEALDDRAGEVTVWATFGRDVNPERLERMGALRWLQMLTAGVDGLPFALLQARGIVVTSTSGIHAIQMSEHALTAMLQLARQAPAFFRAQAAKRWEPDISRDFIELHGKTVGIAGLGAIGLAVAKRAKAFGMRVLGFRRTGGTPPPCVDELLDGAGKELLLGESDFLVLLLPLTPATRGFLGAGELALLKPSAYLVNLGRGPLIDEPALVEALRVGGLAGAALDVFVEEPLPPESPLWTLENVIITPHIGGNSPHYMDRALAVLARNLRAWPDRDAMVNLVDLEQRY